MSGTLRGDVLAIAKRNAWTLLAFAVLAGVLLLIGLVASRRDWVTIVMFGVLGCQTTATLWYRASAREWSERYAAMRECAPSHERIEAMCDEAESGMTLPILFVTDVRRALSEPT